MFISILVPVIHLTLNVRIVSAKVKNRIKFIKQGRIKCTMDGEVTRELKAIRKDLEYIKAHMVDVDMLLTPTEEKLLEQGVKEFESGKTVKLDDFEKE